MKKKEHLKYCMAAIMSALILSAGSAAVYAESEVSTKSITAEAASEVSYEATNPNGLESAYVSSDPKQANSDIAATDFTYTLDENGVASISGYEGSSTRITIPAVIDGHPIREIGYACFQQSPDLESVIIPEGVREISMYAFAECPQLKEVSLPQSLRTIDNNAFMSSGLLTVRIPDGVNKIGDYIFANCNDLKEAWLPSSSEIIEDNCFSGCLNLETVHIPDSIHYIYRDAFAGCSNLKDVDLPKELLGLQTGAFKDCTSLEIIIIPQKTHYIDEGVFSGCTSMRQFLVEPENPYYTSLNGVLYNKEMTVLFSYPCGDGNDFFQMPDSVWVIKESAFRKNNNLKKIIMSTSLNDIGPYAFEGCSSLETVIFNTGSTAMLIEKDAFANCTNLSNVQTPYNLYTVSPGVFSGCTSLKSMRFHDGTHQIQYDAFKDSGLQLIELPLTVEDVGNLFWYCPDLRDVYYAGNQEEWQTVLYGSMSKPKDTVTIHYNSKMPEQPNDQQADIEAVRAFVTRLYQNFLGREPDNGGLEAWTDALTSKRATGAKVVYGFVYSQEFQSNPLSNEAFVTALYVTILGREPDESGMEAWTDVLKTGFTRRKVLEGFLNSIEMKQLCASMGVEPGKYRSEEVIDRNGDVTYFVSRMYEYCMGRQPDYNGLTNWVGALVDGRSSGADIAAGFFFSREMEQMRLDDRSFVNTAYLTLLNREPDEEGLDAWTEVLKEYGDRSIIVAGFVFSQEFDELCRSYGITPFLDEELDY